MEVRRERGGGRGTCPREDGLTCSMRRVTFRTQDWTPYAPPVARLWCSSSACFFATASSSACETAQPSCASASFSWAALGSLLASILISVAHCAKGHDARAARETFHGDRLADPTHQGLPLRTIPTRLSVYSTRALCTPLCRPRRFQRLACGTNAFRLNHRARILSSIASFLGKYAHSFLQRAHRRDFVIQRNVQQYRPILRRVFAQSCNSPLAGMTLRRCVLSAP